MSGFSSYLLLASIIIGSALFWRFQYHPYILGMKFPKPGFQTWLAFCIFIRLLTEFLVALEAAF